MLLNPDLLLAYLAVATLLALFHRQLLGLLTKDPDVLRQARPALS